MGATGLIYEPLLQFDIAAPPKYYPWLATSYQWSNGGKSVTFTIRQGVKFNNGTPMTPADVAFTYNLVKNNKAINLAGLPISSVSTSGNTVTLTFPAAQYTNLQSIAGVPILPQAIWSKVGNPATYPDANPVGTGPYKLKTFTPQGFTLTKNPGYWQASMAKVHQRLLPGVHLQHRRADRRCSPGRSTGPATSSPACRRTSSPSRPAHHHFWEAPGSTNAFIPNLNKWPTNQLAGAQGDQPGGEPHGARLRGRGGPGEPGAQRHRHHAADLLRVERAGRLGDGVRHRQRGRRPGGAEERRVHQGLQRLLPEGRQDRLGHADQPVRLHRLRGGRLDRRAGTEERRDRRERSRASA